MKGHRHVFDLKFLELILDVVEITGHLDIRCIKIMTESVTKVYLMIYEIVLNIIKDYNTLRKRYNKVLI